jgi:hypothetical protein
VLDRWQLAERLHVANGTRDRVRPGACHGRWSGVALIPSAAQ